MSKNLYKLFSLVAGILLATNSVFGESTTIENDVFIYMNQVRFSNAVYSGTEMIASNGTIYSTDKVATNDTRSLYLSQARFVDSIRIQATDTNSDNPYGIHGNGFKIGGPDTADKWFMWGLTGQTNWAFGTYRNESQQYMYLYSVDAQLPTWAVSKSGRHGFNHPDNIMDYHSLESSSVTNYMSFGGINTAKQTYRYTVSIVSTGAVDTWTWKASADNDATYFQYGATNDCATTNMALMYGVTVTFDSATGHTLSDTWEKIAWSQMPVASMEVRPRRFQEVLLGANWHSVTDSYDDISYDAGTGLGEHDILSTTNSSVLCGLKTPVNTFFWNILTPASGLTLVAEYWNGSAWVVFNVTTNRFFDKTLSFTDPAGAEMQYEMSTTTQTNMCPAGKDAASYTLYWYRFRTSTTPTAAPTVQEITPHGEKRFAVYKGMLSPTPSFWVGGRGNVYGDRFFQQDTTTAFSANQLITEYRAQQLVKSAQGTYLYPSTTLAGIGAYAAYTAPQAFNWVVTNAVAANAINYGPVVVYTNANIGSFLSGTNYIPSGTRFTLDTDQAANGTAGFTSYVKYQLIEWGTNGVTNVLATSGNSLAIPRQVTPLSSINLTITIATNTSVISAGNYLAWRSMLVTGGNKVGIWYLWYGRDYNSYFTAGSTASGASAGIQDAPSDNTLYGRSNSTWVAINANTNVTGFSVWRGVHQTNAFSSTNYVAKYNLVDFDTAGAFNTNTYRYTIPVSGLWQLIMHEQVTPLDEDSVAYFWISHIPLSGGGAVTSIVARHQMESYKSADAVIGRKDGTVTCVRNLNAGDIIYGTLVDLNTTRDVYWSGSATRATYIDFSGYLIK